jgi:hypothetical protein
MKKLLFVFVICLFALNLFSAGTGAKVSRIKTWVDDEVLFATPLNQEINNLISRINAIGTANLLNESVTYSKLNTSTPFWTSTNASTWFENGIFSDTPLGITGIVTGKLRFDTEVFANYLIGIPPSYLSNITSDVQNQLDNKQPFFTLLSADSIATGIIDDTTFNYLQNLTGNIQTQINSIIAGGGTWDTGPGDTIYWVLGNVGIGTATPSESLEVSGRIKADTFLGDGSLLTGISTFSGSYNDLTDTPFIPDTSPYLLISDSIVFSGSYNDLTDTPTIPVNSDFTLAGLSEKSYNSLDNRPTIPNNSSFTLAGLGEKNYSSLNIDRWNATYKRLTPSADILKQLDTERIEDGVAGNYIERKRVRIDGYSGNVTVSFEVKFDEPAGATSQDAMYRLVVNGSIIEDSDIGSTSYDTISITVSLNNGTNTTSPETTIQLFLRSGFDGGEMRRAFVRNFRILGKEITFNFSGNDLD